MKTTSKPVSLWECAAFLYLFAPVVVFFATSVRWEIAVLAVPLLLWSLASIARRTSFALPVGQRKAALWYAGLSAACLVLGGAGGFTAIPGDWEKHFAILNFLLKNDWPPTITSAAGDVEVLRYSLGWYLVPALVAKAVGAHNVDLFSAGWSLIGLTIFFSLAADFWPGWKGKIAGPVVFLLFSGMDYVGTQVTGYMLMPTHWEWWAGWMQYTANLTSLFWVPQHALPAWLIIALLLKQWETPTLLEHAAGLLAVAAFWSPFVAVGLAPFYIVLLCRYGLRPISLHWRPIAEVLIVGIPLMLYLISGTGELMRGFIWQNPCVLLPHSPPCFSPSSYALVMALEVLPFVVLGLIAQPTLRPLIFAAAAALAIFPIYRLGIYNDLTMRGSAPAIGLLAIVTVRAALTQKAWLAVATWAILTVGAVTPIGEIQTALTYEVKPTSSHEFDNALLGTFRQQYFAPYRAGLLR